MKCLPLYGIKYTVILNKTVVEFKWMDTRVDKLHSFNDQPAKVHMFVHGLIDLYWRNEGNEERNYGKPFYVEIGKFGSCKVKAMDFNNPILKYSKESVHPDYVKIWERL